MRCVVTCNRTSPRRHQRSAGDDLPVRPAHLRQDAQQAGGNVLRKRLVANLRARTAQPQLTAHVLARAEADLIIFGDEKICTKKPFEVADPAASAVVKMLRACVW